MQEYIEIKQMETMHFFNIISLTLLSVFASFSNSQTNSTTFHVGVILDADSLVGRLGLTSLSLSLSDFYTLNANYSTRIMLHIRDSRAQITGAAASAVDLLKDVQVDAIIGPQKSSQAHFAIGLGDVAKVPVVSFSATSTSLHPQSSYFVQTAPSDAAQVDAIAALVKYFQWYQVVLVYEDSDYGNGIIPYLSNALQQVNARVSYRSVIPVSADEDSILKELYKMKTMQTRVFVVHISSSLASKFFLKTKEAEMMSEGYAWIVTSGIMDLFYSLGSNVVDSMQGVVGVKPLIRQTSKLISTTVRWKEKFLQDHPNVSKAEMSLFGLWAYDTMWGLAMAAERVGFREPSFLQNTSDLVNSTNMFITEISQTGPKLKEALMDTAFEGLGGNFHLVNRQLEPSSFQVLNVAGNGLREVGNWMPTTQDSNERNLFLKGVIWPGESTGAPKGWEIAVSGKKHKVGVPEEAGFPEFIKVERDPQTNATKITGYYIDLFDAVMAALPYAVRYEYVPFQAADASISRSYDDLSNQVSIGTFDAAVGDITITAKRSQYVDFSLPFEEGGITRTQKWKHKNPNDKNIFSKPFEKKLWGTATALFIFTGFALWILEHRLNTAFRGPPAEHVGLIFYIPFMSIVFANRERIVSNLARIVVVIWIFVVLILTSTYTASLSARLTAFKTEKSYLTVEELIVNGDYVGCREGSFIFSHLIGLGFNKSKINTYKTDLQFAEALLNGNITVMFSRTPYATLFLYKYCHDKYMKVGSPDLTEGLAFVFPKGSPFVKDVSRAIVELTDNGIISAIKRRWIRDSTCGERDTSDAVLKLRVSLDSFRVLFGITGGITAICLVLFLASYLYQNRDFVQRIANSGTTTWSKLRAMCKHFDQRDPKSFRSSRANEDGDQIASPTAAHWSTVVPIASEEKPSDSRVVGPNSDNSTATTGQVRSV